MSQYLAVCAGNSSVLNWISSVHIDVVVQFYLWFKFYFPSFLVMVMFDNEFETKENKIQTKDKIEPQQKVLARLSFKKIHVLKASFSKNLLQITDINFFPTIIYNYIS